MMERRLLRQHLSFTMLGVTSSSCQVSLLYQICLCLLTLYYQVYLTVISLSVKLTKFRNVSIVLMLCVSVE
jgi:hypothetical protein